MISLSDNYVFTVVGAYNYDPSIFDGLELPAGPFTNGYPDLFDSFPKPDKDILIFNLLLECSQLSLLHTDVEFLKTEISMWSKMHQLDWQQMYETLLYNYNPIWNKDGTVKEEESTSGSEDRTGSRTTQGSDGNTRTLNTTETDTLSGNDTVNESGTEDATTTNSVNAYNSGTGTEHDRSVIDSDWETEKTIAYGKIDTRRDTGTITEAGTRMETVTDSGENTQTGTRDYERREYGNIGVTMTRQMIREQRNIIMNFYQYIIGAFKERFCILVW